MTRRKNWAKLLKEQEIKDKCKIITEITNKMNGMMKIKFKCTCGEIYIKTMNTITRKRGGFFCKKCTKINTQKMKKKNWSKKGQEEINAKIKKSWLKKSQNQIKEIQNKKEKTCLEKYDVLCITQYEGMKEKSKETMVKKYGVKHALQSKEIQKKIKKTWSKKSSNEIKKIQEKKEETSLKNWGVENPAQSDVIQEKMKKTCLERWGYENPLIEQYNHFRNN
jgi:hypothetical protein